MFGGGIDLSSVKLDQTIPPDLIPDVKRLMAAAAGWTSSAATRQQVTRFAS